ncbi:pirin family protein [Kordiimonas pumila]|uniref:Pirin family protein n=1 Tax=Kordiimonas pumila TaxID=2161677 RepID=A0ABV7D6P4_9PROT|nr:pirin family protein [Kordiimonas pumila]
MQYSTPHRPGAARHGENFKVRQYSRQAFAGLADPVLQVDWFEMAGPTFPPHPHAGFSAVTYLFEDSGNGFINRDSMGNQCEIPAGAMHWSRASRGLVHEEFPIPGKGPVKGLQIFINIPEAYQLDPPAAFHVPEDDMEPLVGEGWISRVAVKGTTLAGDREALPAPVLIEETRIAGYKERAFDVPTGWGGLIILLEGTATLMGGPELQAQQAIAFKAEENEQLVVKGASADVRFVIIAGKRTNQPAFQHGPLTMASAELLQGRLESLNRGEFGTI